MLQTDISTSNSKRCLIGNTSDCVFVGLKYRSVTYKSNIPVHFGLDFFSKKYTKKLSRTSKPCTLF